ncbi:phosphotransferase [Amycolatopsis sacchari]|uniref:Phosphotransferase enzyme family protein n=1 Tax=Amycolatopsis sacchari TaxID=115433 RepID=A0A1I4A4Y9_9PSEU|nr:aminoglycoside phosphotransferase family protein [Amycolatopsis sacchari]SFK50916.1 Phosphotransferase enzyme family protein [Amycolatopsis sacchari]
MEDPWLTSAVAAAVAVGRRLGLPAGEPEVLASRSNVLVRLGPVVARVPATTLLAWPDPTARMARDVALSAFLAERDAPVIPPFEDPGPHVELGLPVTLWRFTRHEPGAVFEPGEAAVLLAEVHAALADFPGDYSDSGPATDLPAMLASSDDPRLPDEVARSLAALPDLPAQPLHGDAHTGNLVRTPDGPKWLDFEDTWRGPVTWDLACLARSDGPGAVAAYPGEVEGLSAYLRLRELYAVCWRFVIARRFPERLPEARAAADRYFA